MSTECERCGATIADGDEYVPCFFFNLCLKCAAPGSYIFKLKSERGLDVDKEPTGERVEVTL